VFILVLASIPVTALVFVFGGVAPDDVIRGYAVLFATVIGLGSIGIFFSALTRRTGASTGLTFVATLALTIGTFFVFIFLGSTAPIDSTGLRKQPPEAILYLNPFVAQADVACGTEDGGFGGTCSFMSGILGVNQQLNPGTDPGFPVPNVKGGIVGGVGITAPAANIGVAGPDGIGRPPLLVDRNGNVLDGDVAIGLAADTFRDRFWPKTVVSFLVLAAVLTLASVQFVSPTRRWRPSLPGPLRRRIRRRSAP
jgi:hypothetical protein